MNGARVAGRLSNPGANGREQIVTEERQRFDFKDRKLAPEAAEQALLVALAAREAEAGPSTRAVAEVLALRRGGSSCPQESR